MQGMEVGLGLLADAANRSTDGKLNMLGVLDVVFAHRFPTRHPRVTMVLRMTCGPAEFGKEKDIEIAFLNEDGKPAMDPIQGKMQVPKLDRAEGKFEQMLVLNDLMFPGPGQYVFVVLIGGEEKYRIPIAARLLPQLKKPTGDKP